MAEPGGQRRPRSYGPTVLLGLAGAGLTALAGTRTWATGHGSAGGIRVDAAVKGSEAAPLVGALGLVALAAWGVVLVTRGWVRRAVAALGLLASAGALAAALAGFGDARHDAVAVLTHKGVTSDMLATDLTAWCYLAVVGGLLTVGCFAVALAKSPSWPAMGSRYDAPAERAARERTEQDMWRALDEGHDPTS
jgi:uncharacterized membrane protein (TIGR02234 family)